MLKTTCKHCETVREQAKFYTNNRDISREDLAIAMKAIANKHMPKGASNYSRCSRCRELIKLAKERR